MSNPEFITLLTEDYYRILDEGYQPPIYGAPVPAVNEKFEDTESDLIIRVEQLFKRIQPQLESSEFYQMVIDGQPGSGKSTIARELFHNAHTAGYRLLYASGFDVTKAPQQFVKEVMGASKVCIILDDLSYILGAVSGKAQSKIKNFFMLIRHVLKQANNGNPVNVLLIVISHFTTAVPPVFKNSNVWLFTQPTNLEYDNMIKIVGRKQQNRDLLERRFQFFQNVHEELSKSPTRSVIINIRNKEFRFKWGDKNDVGDGRLMLALINGSAFIYNSRSIHCDLCKHVGFTVKVDSKDYENLRPVSDDEITQAKDRGTQ